MENKLLSAVITALVSGVIGVTTALITTHFKLKKQKQLDREKEKEQVRLKYLNPLLVAAKDLMERIIDIQQRLRDETEKLKLVEWFTRIKRDSRNDRKSFEYWANDEGYFAMSSLYETAVYFYQAGRIRREFPYIELSPGDDRALLFHLSLVRTAIGGKFGIWETIQDSLGSYLVSLEGQVMKNYREFCELVFDQSDHVWFNRLIDFFKDIHLKRADHLEVIRLSLKDLSDFLHRNLNIRTAKFKITDSILERLARNDVPTHIMKKLEGLKDRVFYDQIEFVAALISLIGPDEISDYKSSILREALDR